jgi:hypothetical protein
MFVTEEREEMGEFIEWAGLSVVVFLILTAESLTELVLGAV